jgi:hypothetical protein
MFVDPATDIDLVHTATGTAFADFVIAGHRETWPIRSMRFRTWLRRRHYVATGAAPNAEAVNSTLNQLEAQAQFDNPERAVHVRVAEHDGLLYLDLADEHWRAVEIGPRGWRIVGRPPVRFRRPAGILALPVPDQGGSIEQLSSLLNLPSQNDFVLVVMWLLATLRGGGSYPLLALAGEQGSAKTTLAKMLRALVDPNAAPVRALPREDRELFIAANNGHLLVYDNLSSLPSWLSDTLCRLASGGGFAVRQLYTDQDEVLFEAARPIILNGIEEVISRPDLADRSIFLTLPPITEACRRSEKELWQQFRAAHPRMLGGLLDMAAHGLRTLPTVHLSQLPRMADFAIWAAACETALWPARYFARAYDANRRASTEDIVEADPVAARIREIMAERTTWAGTASDLLRAGASIVGDEFADPLANWPRAARALAGRLRRVQTSLRALGIEITFTRAGRAGTRIIRMSKTLENTVHTESKVRSNGSRSGSSPGPGSENGSREGRRCWRC